MFNFLLSSATNALLYFPLSFIKGIRIYYSSKNAKEPL